MQRFATGADKDAFAESQRSHRVTRHAVWHQGTPNGTVAIVLIEADDLEQALTGPAVSQEPFDQRFREFVGEVHGVDLANDPPPNIRPIIDRRF
jgi:ribosomal protein L16 Arg81 hydroxylase